MAAARRVTEERPVSGFDRIHLKDVGALVIIQGEQESLVIEADEDLISKIRSEVRGGTLRLAIGQDWFERLFSSFLMLEKEPVLYRLTVKDLRELTISGKGSARAAKLACQDLALQTSGLGEIAIDALAARQLTVEIAGRAEISLRGAVDHQKVAISGSGEYRAEDLASESARITISGHGNAEICARQKLDVNISGFGTVKYAGSPTISQSISGFGSVRQIERPIV